MIKILEIDYNVKKSMQIEIEENTPYIEVLRIVEEEILKFQNYEKDWAIENFKFLEEKDDEIFCKYFDDKARLGRK